MLLVWRSVRRRKSRSSVSNTVFLNHLPGLCVTVFSSLNARNTTILCSDRNKFNARNTLFFSHNFIINISSENSADVVRKT